MIQTPGLSAFDHVASDMAIADFGVLDHGAGRRPTKQTVQELGRPARRGRPGDRWRQLPVQPTTGDAAFLAGRRSATWTAVCRRRLGPEVGYGLMVGGTTELVERAMPLFDALRPEGPREEGFGTPARSARGTSPRWCTTARVRPDAGLREGYELLSAVDGSPTWHAVLKAWTKGDCGSIMLLDCSFLALEQDPGLSKISGYTDDSGEGAGP